MAAKRAVRRVTLGLALAAALCGCLSIGTRRGYEPVEPDVLFEGPLPPHWRGETPGVCLRSGVVVLAHASRSQIHPTPGEQITLDLTLLVPEGVSVQLSCSELALESPTWPEPQRVSILRIEDWTVSPPAVFAPDALIRGTAGTHVHPGFGLSLVTEGPRSQTDIPPVDEFTLHLPALRVEGEVVTPAPLRFRSWERSGVSLAFD